MWQAEEAEEETIRMLRIYEEFATQVAAMPVVAGRKSRLESFAGADRTYTIEAMMGDKRALQVRAISFAMPPAVSWWGNGVRPLLIYRAGCEVLVGNCSRLQELLLRVMHTFKPGDFSNHASS